MRHNTFARSLLNINENTNFKKNQIMKTPLTLFFILFISLSFGQKNLVWHDNLEKALVISKKEKKPIMMFFTGSDSKRICHCENGHEMDFKEALET